MSAPKSTKGGFNIEEIKRLKDLLGTIEKPFECTTFSDNVSCMSVSYSANSWIVDSGAMDHMTYLPQLFHSYSPSPSTRKIIAAHGSLVKVAGYGGI